MTASAENVHTAHYGATVEPRATHPVCRCPKQGLWSGARHGRDPRRRRQGKCCGAARPTPRDIFSVRQAR